MLAPGKLTIKAVAAKPNSQDEATPMFKQKLPETIHGRTPGWTAVILALVLSLGGGVILIHVGAVCSLRSRLQGEADRTALALAGTLAAQVDAHPPRLVSGPVTLGQWDVTRRRFQPGASGVNAVQVVVAGLEERASRDWWRPPLVPDRVSAKTHAVAAIRPRDIVLVVDLSSAMSGETWLAVETLLSGKDLAVAVDGSLRDLYTDLGFEVYPGPLEPFGAPWQLVESRRGYGSLVSEAGPLVHQSTDERYRILPGDPVSERRRKAYLAVIDRQVMRLMPQALPRPDRPENFQYWAGYLDEVLASSDRYSQIGYPTYIRYMLKQGRSIQAGGQHVPLSQFSDACMWHSDVVGGTRYSCPPRTEPMHRVRRGLLRALEDVAVRNNAIEPSSNRDRVAIITFDSLSPGRAWLEQPLSSDYEAVSKKLARLQSLGERAQATAGLEALQLAESILRRSLRETCLGCEVSPLVVFVTTRPTDGQDAIHEQIARMTRIGQFVKVLPVGCSAETATTSFSDTNRKSPYFIAAGDLSSGIGTQMGGLQESSFREAVASASVTLVE